MDEYDSAHNVRFLTRPAFAGFPSPADDDAERRLDLHDLFVAHPISTFFMRVQGDSMTSACIFDGDIIAVDRALTATHNRIIVARLGEGFTLKRLQIIRGSRRIFLKSEHPAHPALEVTGRTDFEVWGVVTWVMHRLAGKGPPVYNTS
jgi:DNA polymerase V